MEGKGAEPTCPSGSKGGSRATEVKVDVFFYFLGENQKSLRRVGKQAALSWAAVPPAGARRAEEGAEEGPGPEAGLGPAMENGGLGAGGEAKRCPSRSRFAPERQIGLRAGVTRVGFYSGASASAVWRAAEVGIFLQLSPSAVTPESLC